MKEAKFWMVTLMLGATACLTVIFSKSPEMVDKQDIQAFPRVIGKWMGKDIPLEQEVYEILETRNVLSRSYSIESGASIHKLPIYLSIIYSEDNRKVSHPPEVCYSGGGTELMGKSEVFIDTPLGDIKANKFIAEKNRQKEMVLYWYVAGGAFTTNYIKQQIEIVSNQIRGKRSGGALVKISAPVIESEEETLAEMKEFIYQVSPIIKRFLGDKA